MAVNIHKPCNFWGISQVSKTELAVLYVFCFDIGWLSKHYALLNRTCSANINCLSVIKKRRWSPCERTPPFFLRPNLMFPPTRLLENNKILFQDRCIGEVKGFYLSRSSYLISTPYSFSLSFSVYYGWNLSY